MSESSSTMPAIFDMIHSGNTSVDAIRLYLQYFPQSKRLALPEYNGETVLMAAVSSCFVVADAWHDAHVRTPPPHDGRDEALALQLHILQTVAQHSWLVTQALPAALESLTCRSIFHHLWTAPCLESDAHDSVQAREQAGLIRTAVLDLVLESLPRSISGLPPSILFLRTTSPHRQLALHQAIAAKCWKAARSLLERMIVSVDDESSESNAVVYSDFDAIVDDQSQCNDASDSKLLKVIPLLQFVLQHHDVSVTSHRRNAAAYRALVEDILDVFESAASTCDPDESTGALPLVTALQSSVPLEIVQLLVEAHPCAVSTPTRTDGDWPLHVAAGMASQDTTVLDYLVAQYPAALSTPNRHGQWPLHCAMEAPPTDDSDDSIDADTAAPTLTLSLVQRLCQPSFSSRETSGLEDSDDCEETDDLNIVVSSDGLELSTNVEIPDLSESSQSSNETVSNNRRDNHGLNNSMPPLSALMQSDSYGDLPLHIACRRLSSVTVETVAWLLAQYASAARSGNRQGHFPLHLAALTSVNVPSERQQPGCSAIESIQLLLDAHPEAVIQPDDDGDTPIHCALMSPNASLDVLECLFSSTRSIAELGRRLVNAHTGQSPLHSACAHGVYNDDIFDALISFDPMAVQRFDNDGNLPLHVALSIPSKPSVCPISILRKLVCNGDKETKVVTSESQMTQPSGMATLPLTHRGIPALFVACQSASGMATTEPDDMRALEVIWFLVERSPELFVCSC